MYCDISRNWPGNGSWLPSTHEALLLDRMHSNRTVRFSEYEMGLRTKNSNLNTTTNLIKKQVGFGQDSCRVCKKLKCSRIRPSCTILKTKDNGITLDMLGCIWIKNVEKFPLPIFQLAFFGVKLPRFVKPLLGKDNSHHYQVTLGLRCLHPAVIHVGHNSPTSGFAPDMHYGYRYTSFWPIVIITGDVLIQYAHLISCVNLLLFKWYMLKNESPQPVVVCIKLLTQWI
mgnify:CR=1 FL=1